MKTGIIRRIDDLGRIVIPKDIRRKLGIKEGDPLEISVDGNKVCFEHYLPSYEDAINTLIDNIKTDEYTNIDKDKVVAALNAVRQAIQEGENK